MGWGGRCGKPSDVASDSYTWGRLDAATPRQAVPRMRASPEQCDLPQREVGNVQCLATGTRTAEAFSYDKVPWPRTGQAWPHARVSLGSCRSVAPKADTQREASLEVSDGAFPVGPGDAPERQSPLPGSPRVPGENLLEGASQDWEDLMSLTQVSPSHKRQ